MPYPAYVLEEACGIPPPGPASNSAAGRSGAIPVVAPDGGIHALSGLRSLTQAHTPQARQAQRRRAVRRCTRGCAGWRHTCLIRPTFPHTGSHPPGPASNSAAGRSGAVPVVVPDGAIHTLSGLRSLTQAHTPQDRQAQRRRAVRRQTRMAISILYL